jgi:uncharacterized protein (DUF362 family)
MSPLCSRRAALQRLGGIGALAASASLVGLACSASAQQAAPATDALPSPAPPSTARVAFVRTADRAHGLLRALRLLEPASFAGKRLLLKPNLNSADPSPGSTHPDTLRALVSCLLEQGAASIVLGDRSGMGNTRQVMRQTGTLDLASELGLETVALDELGADAWTHLRPADSHWSRGFYVPRLLQEVDGVVQTCNLKTHRFGGHFTLSLKNSVGFAAKRVPGDPHDYMLELHNSPYQREMIAEINTAYRPELVVMDGVEAFLDGGPDRGTRAHTQVVLAGTDRVALDAVGVALLRLWGTTPEVSSGPVFQQAQLRRAAELGVGIASPEQIDLLVDDEAGRDYVAQVRAVLEG